MNLTTHFTLEEMTTSQIAEREGIDNTPPPTLIPHLRNTALGLEQVRIRLGVPIVITSGYRSQALERALKRKPAEWVSKSDHVHGWAADFIAPGFGSPATIVSALKDSGIAFDQLIEEYRRWVHISFSPRMRGELLTIDSSGTRPWGQMA